MNFPSMRQLLAVFVLTFAARAAGAVELVVIVSAKSPVGPLRADQVSDLFLGQVGRFPDGVEAFAIDQPVGGARRAEV
jgi:hypothetical protein